MIEYTNYEYYQEIYKGSLSVDLFNFNVKKASATIKGMLNQKIYEPYLDEVQYATCMLIDGINAKNEATRNLASVSVDGVSESYKSNLEIESAYNTLLKEVENILPHDLTRFL